MKRLKERCKNQAVLLTLLDKYDFKPSSIMDFNLGSSIFPDIKDHERPSTPTLNKTKSLRSKQFCQSEEMQNPMPDQLCSNGKNKMTFFFISNTAALLQTVKSSLRIVRSVRVSLCSNRKKKTSDSCNEKAQ